MHFIISGICYFFLFLSILYLIKNNVTHKQRTRLIDAIYDYRSAVIMTNKRPEVDYKDMKSYDAMIFDLGDWSYKHALPIDKFELIKPYIKIKKEKR